MLAIFKRECKVFFTSVTTYIYYAFFFLLTGVFFVTQCLENSSTEFGYYVLSKSILAMVVFIPICTMRLFAQEKRDRTQQMLFTAPVTSAQILAAKFFAAVLVILLPVLASVLYPLIMSMYGTLSMRYVVSSYIGCVLAALILITMGMFISSLVSNPVLAVVMDYALYALVLLSRVIEGIWTEGMVYTILHQSSVYNKVNDMISGVVRSGDVLYMILCSALLLFLTWLVLEKRYMKNITFTVQIIVAVVLFVVCSVTGIHFNRVMDLTAEKVLTLSDETTEVCKNVQTPTTIYYMGLEARANATYQELLKEYDRLNDNIEVVYKNAQYDTSFQEMYLREVDSIREASILVVAGDRKVYLDSSEYVSSTWVSAYTAKQVLEFENQLTSAIYYVNAEDSEKIDVVSGYGETSLTSGFQKVLNMNNYELEEVDLVESADSLVKTFDADSVFAIVNAPQNDYSEDSITELRNYLVQGGNLCVVLDPLNEELPNLYAFLKEYGMDVQSGVVIEPEEGRYVHDTSYYLLPSIEKSDYTEDLLRDNTQVITMTSKGVKEIETENGYKMLSLLSTSDRAYSKVEDFDNIDTKSDGDISGPFSVAAVSEKEGAGSLFVITSDVFFQTEVDADSNGANRKFFLNIINRLTGHQEGIMIEGKEVGTQKAFYPSNTRVFVKIMTLAAIPLLILVIGIMVWFVRRNNILIRFREGGKKNANTQSTQ